MEVFQEMRTLLLPSLEFHKVVVDAGDDDIRCMWDVRFVKGSGEVFGRVLGTSTLPDLLADNHLHTMTEKIHTELLAKIVEPATGKFQDYANKRSLALTPDESSSLDALPVPVVRSRPLEDLAFEAEIISNQSVPD